MTGILREEYPNPQFMRNEWFNLNGIWEFEYDDNQVGDEEKWYEGIRPLTHKIQVPFAFQSQLSGIGDIDFHDTVWYRRTLAIPETFGDKRVILHFGAVDYEATVWVNGQLVATHAGGHTPFHADITHALSVEGNILVVKAVDYSKDLTLPSGKQFWRKESDWIFYTRTTGIWQTVWIEAVSDIHLANVRMTSNIDKHQVKIETRINGDLRNREVHLQIEISFENQSVAQEIIKLFANEERRTIRIHDYNDRGRGRWWTPDSPSLYDIKFTLIEDQRPVDEVFSYFGMRKISIMDGKFCLNNMPFYQKLVLDQGYYPDGNLTPPSDEAIRRDVELTKAMGFNGARKHQKLEDPRYLYWCDKLGLLVWSEAANAYHFSEQYVRKFTDEWQASIERDYNHPCIVAWVPLNESWGVQNIQSDQQQVHHAMALYHLTHSLDSTRLVISNDGWELVQTDLFTIHDYESRPELLRERYSTAEKATSIMPGNRRLAIEGYPYTGQPIIMSEFGGIAYRNQHQEGWGYSGAKDDEDFARRLRDVIHSMLESDCIQGYCYTQLTDVEQEINGLLTYKREPKIPIDVIAAINNGK